MVEKLVSAVENLVKALSKISPGVVEELVAKTLKNNHHINRSSKWQTNDSSFFSDIRFIYLHQTRFTLLILIFFRSHRSQPFFDHDRANF